LFACDYPKDKLDVYIMDSSTDKTKELARRFPVYIIESKAKGKIPKINLGLEKVKTEIVVVSDCDTTLSKNCLKSIVNYLHGKVGAISSTVKEKDADIFYMGSKRDYHKKDWNIRYREGLVDSASSLDGKLLAFRKSLLKKIPEDAFADDFEITLLIRKKGYRCVIDKDSFVNEIPPKTLKEDIKRMRRVLRLTILTSFRHLNILFNPKYGKFGLLIFPFRRFLNLLSPFFLLFIFFYLLFKIYLLIAILCLVLVVSILTFRKSTKYHLILFISLILAWLDIFTGRFCSGAFWKH